LIRPQDKHLDDVEIDAFVSSPDREPGEEKANEPVLQRVRQHIEGCEDCKRKVLIHQAVQKEIAQSGSMKEMPPGPECEIDTDWIEVVAGLLSESKTTALIGHASQCGYCGPRLRRAAEVMADEATPAEMDVVSRLQNARPGWPRQMVRTMKKQDQPERQPEGWQAYFRFPKLVLAGAATAAVALTIWLALVVFRPVSVEQLLAQAYTEKRTLELRIPGAKYGELRVERGSAKSSADRASSLVKAESVIREHLDKTPNDPEWLQAQGRADLLEGNPDSAIKRFEKARESEPDSPSLMADLGIAYYARHTDLDRGKAYELLSQALAKAPDDPVLLFNRAIVAESMGFLDVAEADWKHYLQLQTNDTWSDEVRNRLRKLQEKKESYKKGRSQPLLAPSDLAAQPGAPQLEAIVDARIEEYLHLAIQDWLPRAYPPDERRPSDVEARAALGVLSRITRSHHGDAWLEDLLANSRGQTFGAAVQALSAALAGNDRGDYDEAHRESVLAERLFLAEQNPAGVLQARFQRLFALQFIRNGKRCAQVAEKAAREVMDTSYTWLQAQILLEESSCSTTNADLGHARSRIAKALAISQSSAYKSTFLRCLNFSAGNATLIGDMRASWALVLEGLDAFWSGNSPALRGYSLYTALAQVADRASLPYLQVAAWSQGIALIDADADLLQRGLAHFYLAQAAMDAHLLPLFDSEYQEYNRLLDLAPAGAAEKTDRGELQLVTAKLEIRRGHLSQAHDRLKALLGAIQGSGNTYRAADFYATLGQQELELGNNQDADRFLRSGLLVTEHILGTLRTEKERMEWERKASPIYRALVEEKLREGDAASALEVWEWYLGAAIREPAEFAASSAEKHLFDRAAMEGVPLSTLTIVASNRSRLTRQTVLSYALLRDGVAIWAFDNRDVFHVYVHRDPQEVEQLARHFLELCADRDSDPGIVRKYGQELYNLLLAPIAARLEPERGLIIEADSALALVPFEALVDPASHYLGQERTIVSSLGLYYDLKLRPLRPITPSDMGLVVAVASPKGFNPLPDLDTETKTVAGRFSRPIVLTENDASLHAVLRALPSASVFYFAGHAVAAPEPGLVMADLDPGSGDPRRLTAELLTPESLKHLQIAVLAGCDTDTGDEGNYNDVTSLVRTMVRAGVPSIVASRWKLVSGAPDRVALPLVFPRKASQTSTHPYYWASLNQFGGLDVIP
jgi:CHAT domain-containing protein/cytochrome c-type biogenesis protein CcmH/NrfG